MTLNSLLARLCADNLEIRLVTGSVHTELIDRVLKGAPLDPRVADYGGYEVRDIYVDDFYRDHKKDGSIVRIYIIKGGE